MWPEIIIPHYVTRTFIQSHLEYNFVFSFDVAGKSFFGQANECYGEPNAYPVPVRWKGCKTSGYFSDAQYIDICEQIDIAISRIPNGPPVIVLRKIGEGASRMNEFASKSFEYLKQKLNEICYPNIKIKYE